MNWNRWVLAGILCAATSSATLAHGPGVSIGIGVGLPLYPRPCYAPYYSPYYYPGYYYRPVYVAQPVVVQPAPVYVPQPVVVQQAPTTAPPPLSVVTQPTTTVTAFPPAELKKPNDVGQLFAQLNDPDEKTRSDVVIQLGRLKLDQAVDPLCATLAGDKSSLVRDSAAKALGMIGATRSLTALIHAAQADADNDVRHSAQFAVEIIKLNNNLK